MLFPIGQNLKDLTSLAFQLVLDHLVMFFVAGGDFNVGCNTSTLVRDLERGWLGTVLDKTALCHAGNQTRERLAANLSHGHDALVRDLVHTICRDHGDETSEDTILIQKLHCRRT